MAIDAARPRRLIGQEQHAVIGGGFPQAMPARIGPAALDPFRYGVAEFVDRSVSHSARVIRIERDAAEAMHVLIPPLARRAARPARRHSRARKGDFVPTALRFLLGSRSFLLGSRSRGRSRRRLRTLGG